MTDALLLRLQAEKTISKSGTMGVTNGSPDAQELVNALYARP